MCIVRFPWASLELVSLFREAFQTLKKAEFANQSKRAEQAKISKFI